METPNIINRSIKSVEPTPLSFAIQLFLGSLLILFLTIILFAKRGCSTADVDFNNEKGGVNIDHQIEMGNSGMIKA